MTATVHEPLGGSIEVTEPDAVCGRSDSLLQALLMGAVRLVSFAVPAYAPDRIEFSTALVEHVQRRSGELRITFSADIVEDPRVKDHIAYLVGRGIAPRLAMSVPHRMAVVDRRVGVVDGVLVHDPARMREVLAASEGLWSRSRPVRGIGGDANRVGHRQARIMSLLADGHTDETVARRVGVSVRTVRGDVATLMQQFAATSRFQAGVQAARLGLV